MILSNYLILAKKDFMKIIWALLAVICMLKGDDFINKMVYARLLYSNPRGLGCNKCHGDNTKGSSIALYKQKGEIRALIAPPVNNLSKDRFIAALNNPKSVIPRYSLALDEVESLYEYVNSQK
jgi:hypothetical protein